MADPYWLPEPAMDPWANVLGWACIVAVVAAGAAMDVLNEKENSTDD